MAREKDENRIDRLERLAEEMFAGIAQLRESQSKTDEQIRRTDAKLDRIGKQLGDLGLVQGEVAEDLFYRNLKGVFKKTKMDIKKVKRSLKRKGEDRPTDGQTFNNTSLETRPEGKQGKSRALEEIGMNPFI